MTFFSKKNAVQQHPSPNTNGRIVTFYRPDGSQTEPFILNNDMLNYPFETGELLEDGSIYLGTWRPIFRRSTPSEIDYHVIVAPTSMKERNGDLIRQNYREAVDNVANIYDLCGHEGGYFKNDQDLLKSLWKEEYRGEWFIPPVEIFNGKTLDGQQVVEDTFQKHWLTGAFYGTFYSLRCTAYDGIYFTSSMVHRKITVSPVAGDARVGYDYGINSYPVKTDIDGFNCRLCRLERTDNVSFLEYPPKETRSLLPKSVRPRRRDCRSVRPQREDCRSFYPIPEACRKVHL